jgi:phospholipase/lecithinase/hemolysin
VPPVDRSPGTLAQGSTVQCIEAAAIGNFNFLLQGAVRNFAAQYLDAAVFLFDTNWIFTLALDNPGSFQPTAGLRNTTDFCNAYQNGTPQPDSFDPACSVPVNQYFWLNSLHPTYPIHQAIAQRIAGQLL